MLDGRDYVGALAVKSYTDVMHCFTSCVYEHDNRDIIPRDYNHVDSVIHPLFKSRGVGAQPRGSEGYHVIMVNDSDGHSSGRKSAVV